MIADVRYQATTYLEATRALGKSLDLVLLEH